MMMVMTMMMTTTMMTMMMMMMVVVMMMMMMMTMVMKMIALITRLNDPKVIKIIITKMMSIKLLLISEPLSAVFITFTTIMLSITIIIWTLITF